MISYLMYTIEPLHPYIQFQNDEFAFPLVNERITEAPN